MITTTKPDKQKAQALKKTALTTLERLKTTDTEKYPANTLKDYYDIIHELMEAKALLKGIKTYGEGAHQELIDYIAETQKLDEQTRQFLQQMREYRNKISYEGFNINKNFITLNQNKIKDIIKKLLEQINKKTQKTGISKNFLNF